MTGPIILWLLFLSWVIHDIEELCFFETLDDKNNTTVQNIAGNFSIVRLAMRSVATNRKEEAIAIVIVGLLMLAATIAGYLDPHGIGMLLYGTMLGGYFLHTFAHVGVSIILRKYMFGLVTAIIVVLPAAICLYAVLFDMQLLSLSQALWTALVGIIAFGPILILVLRLGKIVGTLHVK